MRFAWSILSLILATSLSWAEMPPPIEDACANNMQKFALPVGTRLKNLMHLRALSLSGHSATFLVSDIYKAGWGTTYSQTLTYSPCSNNVIGMKECDDIRDGTQGVGNLTEQIEYSCKVENGMVKKTLTKSTLSGAVHFLVKDDALESNLFYNAETGLYGFGNSLRVSVEATSSQVKVKGKYIFLSAERTYQAAVMESLYEFSALAPLKTWEITKNRLISYTNGSGLYNRKLNSVSETYEPKDTGYTEHKGGFESKFHPRSTTQPAFNFRYEFGYSLGIKGNSRYLTLKSEYMTGLGCHLRDKSEPSFIYNQYSRVSMPNYRLQVTYATSAQTSGGTWTAHYNVNPGKAATKPWGGYSVRTRNKSLVSFRPLASSQILYPRLSATEEEALAAVLGKANDVYSKYWQEDPGLNLKVVDEQLIPLAIAVSVKERLKREFGVCKPITPDPAFY